MFMDGYDEYFRQVYARILPRIDNQRLQESYRTTGAEYAKEVLGQLHGAFVQIYGQEALDMNTCGFDMVMLPGVIEARDTKDICLALLSIDMESSGEHWGTVFLTGDGPLEQGDKTLPKHLQKKVQSFIPYEYWYTPTIRGDIHVDNSNIPHRVQSLLDAGRACPVQSITPKNRGDAR